MLNLKEEKKVENNKLLSLSFSFCFSPFLYTAYGKMGDQTLEKYVTDYMISENESSSNAIKAAEKIMERK